MAIFWISPWRSRSSSGVSAFESQRKKPPGSHVPDRTFATLPFHGPLRLALHVPVDRGLPVSTCSIRCSSSFRKHPFKNRSPPPVIRPYAPNEPLGLIPVPLPHPRKRIAGPWRNSFRQRCSRFGLSWKARVTSAAEDPSPASESQLLSFPL